MELEVKNKTLTADDICNIIKASKKSGLKKLVFGELNLEFDTTAAIVGTQKETTVHGPQDITQLSFPEIGKLDSPTKPESMEDLVDMDHLAVSDPATWEKLHLEGNYDAAENGHNEA